MRAVVVLALLLVACDSGAVDPGPTTAPTTTTTIDNDTCDRVGEDTVRYLEDVIDTLDQTRLRDFVDPSAWGQPLLDLQRAGKDLDLRVDALRCDPVEIQQRAFAEADLAPTGSLSAGLLDLLLTPPETTTTTTTTIASDTTTSTTTDSSSTSGESSTTTSGG